MSQEQNNKFQKFVKLLKDIQAEKQAEFHTAAENHQTLSKKAIDSLFDESMNWTSALAMFEAFFHEEIHA